LRDVIDSITVIETQFRRFDFNFDFSNTTRGHQMGELMRSTMGRTSVHLFAMILWICVVAMSMSACASATGARNIRPIDNLKILISVTNVETAEQAKAIVKAVKEVASVANHEFGPAAQTLVINVQAYSVDEITVIHERLLHVDRPQIAWRFAKAQLGYYTVNIIGQVTIVLRSKVTPGARLWINDVEVEVGADGSFMTEIQYTPGVEYIKAKVLLGDLDEDIWIPIDNSQPILDYDPSGE
jgi:hypothetical protein